VSWFRYLKRQPTSLVVYLSFAVFLILWPTGFLGSYAVTVGTILGSTAIALSSIGSGDILDKWIIAGIGTAVVGLCAATDTSEQLRAQRLRSELEQDIQAYAAPADVKHGFVSFVTDHIGKCLNTPPVDVDHCAELESLLEHVDKLNGGVPYYSAEILRSRGRIRDSDDHLYNYLEADKRRPPAGDDDGSISACATNGYCRQRTAWVCHTLANDLFRRGCDVMEISHRRDFFERAQQKLACVNESYKGGFEQRLGTRPLNTADLTAALELNLKNPSRPCSPRPKT